MLAFDLTAPVETPKAPTHTDEQLAILDQPPTETIIVEAGAGVGKTSTLVAYAKKYPRKRGLYVAFNKAIAEEAKASFPSHIRASTTHGYAFRALGIGRHQKRLVSKIRRQSIREAGINLVNGVISPDKMLRAITEGVHNFCNDAGSTFLPAHCGLDKLPRAAQERLIPLVASAVKMFLDYETSGLPFTHDIYLKKFEMVGRLGADADYIMVDEAQDTNPVLMSMLEKAGKPIVVVGDPHQSIYGFRGAHNALAHFEGKRFPLSLSWRFGPEIAKIANHILSYSSQSNDHPIRGRPDRQTDIVAFDGVLQESSFILARTNARLFEALIGVNVEFHVAGGFDVIASQLLSALALAHDDQQNVKDPFVRNFGKWEDLLEEAEDGDPDARRLAKLIGQYGNEIPIIIDRLRALHRPHHLDAKLLLSTAHKAKGLEADVVILLDDFETPDELKAKFRDEDITRIEFDQECNLNYVAVTRARFTLMLSGAMWNWWQKKSVTGAVRPCPQSH